MNRVAVTGIGVVCAIGSNRAELAQALREGRHGFREITLFDASAYRTHRAAEVPALPPCPPSILSAVERHRLSRADLFALGAALEALGEADYDPMRGLPEPERFGVVLGTGAGGMFLGEQFMLDLLAKGERARGGSLRSQRTASSTDLLARVLGLAGERSTIMTACSSSSTAIGYAADLIRFGRADRMLAGGTDALCRLTHLGFNSLKAVAPDVCRPFDRGRQGLVLGEGAGIFVLERMKEARRRGAVIHGEVLGYGLSSDAYHMTSPDPAGAGPLEAIRACLASAGVDAGSIDYVNAHGTGTPINDKVETVVLKAALGERAKQVPVSSIKSMVGHCLGACGGIEAVATVIALSEGFLPPTANYREPDPECDLDWVPNEARRAKPRIALSNSFAFGGNNTVLLLGGPP